MTEENKAIVIDCGEGFIKAGTSLIDAKAKIIANVYSIDSEGNQNFGYEAISKRKEVPLKNTMQGGKITDWDIMKNYCGYLYKKELNLEPANHPVLFCAHDMENKTFKEKAIELFLEDILARGFYVANTSLMSLYGSGLSQGVIIDSGHSKTSVVVSQDGIINEHQEIFLPVGGKHLDELVGQRVSPNITDTEFIRNIKLNKCKIQESSLLKDNLGEPEPSAQSTTYTLPDGSNVLVNQEVISTPEVLLKPELLGLRKLGIHEMIYDSVMESEYDFRRDHFSNLIFSGGNFNIPGLASK